MSLTVTFIRIIAYDQGILTLICIIADVSAISVMCVAVP